MSSDGEKKKSAASDARQMKLCLKNTGKGQTLSLQPNNNELHISDRPIQIDQFQTNNNNLEKDSSTKVNSSAVINLGDSDDEINPQHSTCFDKKVYSNGDEEEPSKSPDKLAKICEKVDNNFSKNVDESFSKNVDESFSKNVDESFSKNVDESFCKEEFLSFISENDEDNSSEIDEDLSFVVDRFIKMNINRNHVTRTGKESSVNDLASTFKGGKSRERETEKNLYDKENREPSALYCKSKNSLSKKEKKNKDCVGKLKETNEKVSRSNNSENLEESVFHDSSVEFLSSCTVPYRTQTISKCTEENFNSSTDELNSSTKCTEKNFNSFSDVNFNSSTDVLAVPDEKISSGISSLFNSSISTCKNEPSPQSSNVCNSAEKCTEGLHKSKPSFSLVDSGWLDSDDSFLAQESPRLEKKNPIVGSIFLEKDPSGGAEYSEINNVEQVNGDCPSTPEGSSDKSFSFSPLTSQPSLAERMKAKFGSKTHLLPH